MSSDWFKVDKAGLAAILERRGKSFAVAEIVSNACDSGTDRIDIKLTPVEGAPQAQLTVEDWGEGFDDLRDAFTLFSRSRRAADATKRGRFSLGEKLVLAICRRAMVVSTKGAMIFDEDGARLSRETRPQGTAFIADIRMTRDELRECIDAVHRFILPVKATLNGEELERPAPLAKFKVKLPTEVADADGNLRKTIRECTVEAYAANDDYGGEVLEMGIPIQRLDCPWRLNVLQKVPLGFDRDSVTDAFRRALTVAATNALAETLTDEQSAAPWATEVMGDARVAKETISTLVQNRFGDRAVVAVPGDPLANAQAEAAGSTVIHGGALPAEAWANIRKHALIPSTSQAFPTPKPMAKAEMNVSLKCPNCGTAIPMK